MKNIFIIIVIITFSLSINAQIYTPAGIIQGASINDNIGIGTSNTIAKLTIQAGPNNYPTPLKAISIWGPTSPANSNSAQDISWDFAAAGSAVIRSFRGSHWDTYLQFLTNSSLGGNAPQVRMQINDNGNVGIGTEYPSQKLDVNGNALFQGTLSSSISGVIGGQLQLKNPAKTASGSASSWNIYNMTEGYGNSLQFWAYDNLGCGTGLCNNRFTIMDNGNVGIGAVNPQNKLDVNGIIHSKEVKVDMSGWSDFVFKKEYNLPTLEDVEKYITEKGHLENIPNEEEVLKNGINLGEMNAKLLQKIEELTLYVIEIKKENSKMKIKQKQLDKKILQLSNRYKS
ncbi:hypothetical protein [Flavobacterium reichenbachii]|uniref:hypothetical protein n=1 Tax=Flavobacterium reichenbachii TaxID=362418 RepID=UPI00068F6A16|nr:hypothetical protein [Flavobacterium reichenbachii]OXB15780.1 hypothetical protein B0A68_08930 [Flavobacterium reichenbachii]